MGQLKKDKEQATQKVRELEASLEAYIKKIRVSVVLCFFFIFQSSGCIFIFLKKKMSCCIRAFFDLFAHELQGRLH